MAPNHLFRRGCLIGENSRIASFFSSLTIGNHLWRDRPALAHKGRGSSHHCIGFFRAVL